jgi:hypothetical protein
MGNIDIAIERITLVKGKGFIIVKPGKTFQEEFDKVVDEEKMKQYVT